MTGSLPAGAGYVTLDRRSESFVARITRSSGSRTLGHFATREAAREALAEALAPRRPCGAEVQGGGELCYWHAKVAGGLEVNGHELADRWRPAATTFEARRELEEELSPHARREPSPLVRCAECGELFEAGPYRQHLGDRLTFCTKRCGRRYHERQRRRRASAV